MTSVFYLLFCHELVCMCASICISSVHAPVADVCECMSKCMNVSFQHHHIYKCVVAQVLTLHFLFDIMSLTSFRYSM